MNFYYICIEKSYVNNININLFGSNFDDCLKQALLISKEENKIFIHPYDDYDVINGQATIGYEILNSDLVNNRFEEFKNNKKLTSLFINVPQYIVEKLSQNLACSIFGGYSLVVLAK